MSIIISTWIENAQRKHLKFFANDSPCHLPSLDCGTLQLAAVCNGPTWRTARSSPTRRFARRWMFPMIWSSVGLGNSLQSNMFFMCRYHGYTFKHSSNIVQILSMSRWCSKCQISRNHGIKQRTLQGCCSCLWPSLRANSSHLLLEDLPQKKKTSLG